MDASVGGLDNQNSPHGDGEMAERIRAHDWTATPLGPVERWPTSLRVATHLLVHSRHPMFIWWGPEHIQIYNDAYRETMGPEKHPSALGRSGRETWAEIWDVIEPQIEQVMCGGPATWHEDQLVPVTRHGGLKAVWWTYSFSPIEDDAAPHGVGGVMVICRDVTEEHLAREAAVENEERQAVLLALTDALPRLNEAEAIIAAATQILGDYLKADRTFVAEMESDGINMQVFDEYLLNGAPSVIGHHNFDTFGPFVGPILARGDVLVVDNIADLANLTEAERTHYAAVGIAAYLLVPLVRNGRFVACFAINHRTARPWSQTDKDMARQTADRTWTAVERARAEAALRESEEKYRNLYTKMGQGYIEVELIRGPGGDAIDYRYVVLNPAYEQLTGIPIDKAVGRRSLEVIPDLSSFWAEIFQRIVDNQTAEEFEYEEKALDRWFGIYAYPGDGDRLTVLALDITQRKKAEAALRESEERYRTLFETMDEGFVVNELVRDDEGRPIDLRYLELNPAVERLVGWDAKDTVGRLMSEMITPEETKRWVDDFAAVIASGKSSQTEHNHESLGMWFRANATPIGADRVALVYQNITDQKRSEAILRESEERQAFLLKLSDALRPLASPADIQGETTRLLREELNAGWCYYVDWNLDKNVGLVLRDSASEGLPSLAGAHDVSDAPEFLQLLAGGAVLTIRDYAGYEQLPARIRQNFVALGFRSLVAAPLFKDGRLIASLLVGDSEIRDWSTSEASLVLEVAERTWAAIERERAEAALREGEIRLAQLADAAPVLIWETGEEGAIFVNSHYLAYFGVAFEDIAGFRWEQYIHPDDLEGYVAAYQQAFAERRAYDYECRLLRADGQYRWHRTSGGPSSNGRFVGSCTDIHALVVAEQALRQREEQQRLTIELVPALLWSASPDGQEVSLNEGWTTYTGQSEAETQGYGWLGAIHPDDLPATQVAFEHAFATGEPPERQQRIRKAGDGWRWHLVRQVPVRDESGAITRWFGAAVDIHESKLAEQAVREAELRLQTLVEGLPQLVWRAVGDGQWTWASPQWTTFTGQAEPDSHDRGWLDPVHPDDRDGVMAIWAGAIERGEFHADYRILHATEQRYRWFQTRATAVRDDAGEIVEWLGTSTDVDDIRELQERQGVLVAELQHRTRNLMGVVRSMAARTGEASENLDDFLARFRDRLEALARVQGLLSRLGDIDRIAFDELIGTEIKAMNGASERVTLEGPAGIRLRSSMVQTLAMALHELATNAVKYGALSQPQAELAIRWRMTPPDKRGRPWLHIDWRESGVRMPPPGAAPQGTGQGRELIEKALPYQFGAQTSFELGPDGAHCTLSIPVSASNVEQEAAYA